MFSVAGKKTIITGATGGIGHALAQGFGQAGAQLVLSGSNPDKLSAVSAEFPAAKVLACNLAQMETVEAFAKQAEEHLQGVDVLVANAGITRDTLSIRMSDAQWQEVINVNLTSTFVLARACLKRMIKQRSGRIIFITSVVGHTGNPGQANYCAAKAGITGMSKALAQEAASRGVTINCIAPGFIATPMTEVLTEEQKSRITTNIPAGRMGTPQDIAAAALYLASDAAAYITGHTLHVNGGLFMQ